MNLAALTASAISELVNSPIQISQGLVKIAHMI